MHIHPDGRIRPVVSSILMTDHARLIVELSDGRPRTLAGLSEDLGTPPEGILAAFRELSDRGISVVRLDANKYCLAHAIEPLDSGLIRESLPEQVRRKVVDLDVQQRVDSTNARLMRFSSHDVSGVRVCLAEMQTGGRGRRGREWLSPYAGGVYLSVRQHVVPGQRHLGALSPLLALNLADALRGLGARGIGVKWPNDLVRSGRKLGGILIETRVYADQSVTVVCGVGVNYRFPPEWSSRSDQPIVDLHEIMPRNLVSRNRVAAVIIATVVDTVCGMAWHGVRDLPVRWRVRDDMVGKVVELREGNGKTVRGCSAGIDCSGRIVLHTERGQESFALGDVSLREAM